MESTPTRTPKVYRHLDNASAALLLFMTVWAPWAFGCTTYWTIQVLNYAGYSLGALLGAKWIVRWRTGYNPPRWSEPTPAGRWLVRLLAGLTVFILAYVLVSVLNARATAEWTRAGADLTYFDRTPIPWLPSSYDSSRSLAMFRNWLGIALAFWAGRDWLLGKTRHERKLAEAQSVRFPAQRPRLLLWVVALNGALLGLECILQRLDGTQKLLWLMQPAIESPADFHFGPYAYRTNAAQYFNLVWPVALGFWWTLRQDYRERHGASARVGGGAHVILLPCGLLLAACPLISTSRGGALIMGLLTLGAVAVLWFAPGAGGKGGRLLLAGVLGAVLGFGLLLGGSQLRQRFATEALGLSGRDKIYEVAHRMAADFGWLGSGAGSFASLYPLYRTEPEGAWEAYAHNDWLETRITLGWLGFGTLILMLAIIPGLALPNRGTGGSREFALLLALALGGMLVHAAYDFPFVIHSLLFQFILLLAVASCLGGRRIANP